jgi:peptide/nickel transport system permease protein
MFRYIVRRLLQLIPVLIGISFITFALSFIIPGDPVRSIMGQRSDREAELHIRQKFGLDKPWYVQYVIWARNLIRNPGSLPQFKFQSDNPENPAIYPFTVNNKTVLAFGGKVYPASNEPPGEFQSGANVGVVFDLSEEQVIDGMFDEISRDASDIRSLRNPAPYTVTDRKHENAVWKFSLKDEDGEISTYEMMPNAILLLGGNRSEPVDYEPGLTVNVAFTMRSDTTLWAAYDAVSEDMPEIESVKSGRPESITGSGRITETTLSPAMWFDLGRSYRQQREVRDIIRSSFKNTAYLSIVAMLIAVLVGITAGILSAVKPYSFVDYLTMTIALIGVSMPVFWLGLMLILLFQGQLGWIKGIGFGEIAWIPINLGLFVLRIPWHQNVILPGITLATVPMAIVARMTRSSMLEVMNLDYIRTARAKGLSEWAVVMKHALKNSLIPIITVIGVDFALLLAGAVLTETVFSWPGLGREIVDAIEFRDFPVVMGGVVLFAFVFVLVNLVVDILYAYVDPRIRYQ